MRSIHLIAFFLTLLLTVTGARVSLAQAQSSLVHSPQTKPHPLNLDFEEGKLGQVPDGWDCPTKVSYSAELTDKQPKSGKRAAVLHSVSTTAVGSSFGNLMQAMDATAFRGRRVRFKAYVRIEANEDEGVARLWLRVDRTEGRRGFFDNMMDRPISSAEWQEYEIVGDVDEDATVINIGIILIGKGKAWIDAASFEDLGKVVTRADPPRALTGRGLANLIAFTRLLGYVRHFHPSDEAAATKWDSFAVQGMLSVEDAKTPDELAQKLTAVFRPIAPTVRTFPTAKPTPADAGILRPADMSALKIVTWKHKGFGQRKASLYHSERVYVPVASGDAPGSLLDPNRILKTDLGGGVSCIVPLALFVDEKGTLPHVTAAIKSAGALVRYSGNDRATRLADVALAWNVLQHFYPYFDVVPTDWPKALKDALASAATDVDERAFLITLRRMIAQLHDGHGNVFHASESNAYSAPVIFGWIEDRVVITDVVGEGAGSLEPGDIVVKVNGKPSLDVLTESEILISGATPQWRRTISLYLLAAGPKDSELRLDVQNQAGQLRSVVLRRTADAQSLTESRPPKISEIKSGIFYVALDRIKDEDFQAALPQLEKAKGIIFDLRGYPTVSPMILSHLTDKPLTSARWMVPIITKPDHADVVEYDTGGRWDLKPIAPKLNARIAFLTDGRAISYAESYMGIVEAYKLAEIVGEPTAGTNGDVNPFTLPGGYQVVWTGMKVLKHDGSQHHGIGIQPTIPVSRTIQGVREKRDEQLERAIAIVSK